MNIKHICICIIVYKHYKWITKNKTKLFKISYGFVIIKFLRIFNLNQMLMLNGRIWRFCIYLRNEKVKNKIVLVGQFFAHISYFV